jgi:acetyltransferase
MDVAKHVIAAAATAEKPVVCCLVGGESITEAVTFLNQHGVPLYDDPSRAARALGGLWTYHELRNRPDLTPEPLPDVDSNGARRVLREAEATSGDRFLDAEAAAQVAAAYGIRVPKSGLASTADEAANLAGKLGYPLVMKLIAPDVVHKADVGGIILNLTGEAEVRAAFQRLIDGDSDRRSSKRVMLQQMAPAGQEVILGAQRDPQFGPVLMFGMGGIFVEALRDVAFRLAPISQRDALQMIGETAAGNILKGIRGRPSGDISGVVETLRRVGQLMIDVPAISELDINPLIVGDADQGVWAVDVRIAVDRPPDEGGGG